MESILEKKNKATAKIFFLFSFPLLVLWSASVSYSQKNDLKKADSYFSNNEFTRAIPLYKKAAGTNDEALRKLADCYRFTKDYREAELHYGKLAEKKPSDPMVYFYYGEALLNNSKYDDAKKQFSVYSIINPDDSRGEIYAKVCDQLKELLAKPALYKVYNLGDINSSVADFCPAFYEDGIVFSSERIKDIVNFSQGGSGRAPYMALVYSKGEKIRNDSMVYTDSKLFSDNFYGGGHYGPACFSADYAEIYFMKVDNTVSKRGAISQPKIYYSKNKIGWSAPKVLPFCNDNYATGHPTISKDGQTLYFISNRTGGMGGTDIWFSERQGDSWGEPQNMGKEINTQGNETYPYISKENILYFSSNGHPGFGGLDIFAAVQKDGKWGSVSNLMLPVNSTANDFGIIFKNDNSGYFSSSRAGGKGSDDLYGFSLSGLITSISGKILYSSNPEDGAKNVKVFLLTDKGVVLYTTSTDGSGFFRFDNLQADQNYMVRLDVNDPSLTGKKKFYLADADNKVVRVAVKGKDGFFIFENLPVDLTRLTLLIEEDVSIAGNLYSGDERSPVKNIKVNLLNNKGEVIQSATTNTYGSFILMHPPPKENFSIKLEGVDEKLASKKIYFTNKDGKEIAVCDGRICEFRILATDKNTLSMLIVEDSDLLVDLEGTLFADKKGKSRLKKTMIYLVDKEGKVIGTYQTDAMGNFKFSNLPVDKNYMIQLKEDDSSLSAKDIFLADSKGRIVATLREGGKFFRFNFLPVDEQTLAKIYFNDPWLKAAILQSETKPEEQMVIIEKIYFDYQKFDLLPQAFITLNKVVRVMKENPGITIELIAHTDSRGTDEFNMQLSGKRAQAAVNYIVSKGIDKKRLSAKGLGEARLANNCKDGVECGETEHAQNRRTEFRIKKTKN